MIGTFIAKLFLQVVIRANGRDWLMKKVLHILRSEPDDTVVRFVDILAGDESVAVVNLYEDQISGSRIDWHRLVDDIFNFDTIICW